MDDKRSLQTPQSTGYCLQGDRDLYSTARADLKRGIKDAKKAYKRRIEDYFTDNDTRRVWQGVQHFTNYKGNSTPNLNNDASLAEELNCFFAQFEAKTSLSHSTLPDTGTQALTVQVHEVRRMFKTVKPRKATGPDGVPGKVLQARCSRLVLFNLLLFSPTSLICPLHRLLFHHASNQPQSYQSQKA